MWFVSCACETMFRCFEVTWQGVSFSWRGEGLIVSSQNHRRTLQVCKMLQCDATTIVKYCNWQFCQDVRKQWQSGRAAWARSDVWEILSLPHFIYIRCCHTTQLSADTYLESKSWMQWLCFSLVPPPPICRDSLSRCGSKTLLLLVV